eukprot:g6310.t1
MKNLQWGRSISIADMYGIICIIAFAILRVADGVEWDCAASTNTGTFTRSSDCTISGNHNVHVTGTLQIVGSSTDMENLVTISAAGAARKKRHFYLNGANDKLFLRYVKLVGGDGGSDNGGSIYIDKNGGLQLHSCILSNNKARFGGGIYARGLWKGSRVRVYAENSILQGNHAISGGGGMFILYGTVTLTKHRLLAPAGKNNANYARREDTTIKQGLPMQMNANYARKEDTTIKQGSPTQMIANYARREATTIKQGSRNANYARKEDITIDGEGAMQMIANYARQEDTTIKEGGTIAESVRQEDTTIKQESHMQMNANYARQEDITIDGEGAMQMIANYARREDTTIKEGSPNANYARREDTTIKQESSMQMLANHARREDTTIKKGSQMQMNANYARREDTTIKQESSM